MITTNICDLISVYDILIVDFPSNVKYNCHPTEVGLDLSLRVFISPFIGYCVEILEQMYCQHNRAPRTFSPCNYAEDLCT